MEAMVIVEVWVAAITITAIRTEDHLKISSSVIMAMVIITTTMEAVADLISTGRPAMVIVSLTTIVVTTAGTEVDVVATTTETTMAGTTATVASTTSANHSTTSTTGAITTMATTEVGNKMVLITLVQGPVPPTNQDRTARTKSPSSAPITPFESGMSRTLPLRTTTK